MTEAAREEQQMSEDPPRKRRLTLAGQVLLGLALGIAAGIVFGEMVGWLKVVGDVFVRLLQVTVIPYISLSLDGAQVRSAHSAAHRALARWQCGPGSRVARCG